MPAKLETLQRRKQELVRDTIWEAALDLFTIKGFDESTIEEIAEAADVSRRSFFRYFASKRDLMVLRVHLYGRAVGEAIEECPRSCSLFEVMEHATLKVARAAAAQPRTRQVFKIAERCAAANEALLTSLPRIEEEVAKAFERRLPNGAKERAKARLLAAFTFSILNVSLADWCKNERKDISTIVSHAFTTLSQLARG
jgi:AcrR family transcriptional regulator